MLKNPVVHKTNVIYKDTCSCSEFYIGETKQNSEVRWGKHCSTKKSSELGDHLLLNPGHTVNWEILANAPKQVKNGKYWRLFTFEFFNLL